VGRFLYAGETAIEVDDRLLAHLRVVILTKLRRRESLALTLDYAASEGSGHTVLWLHPAIAIQFEIFSTVHLNPRWIQQLILVADTPAGLRPMREPDDTNADNQHDEEQRPLAHHRPVRSPAVRKRIYEHTPSN
jgi:hypothetical protein